MQGNPDRILTTHVGSLPRTVEVLDAMKARRGGEDVDEAAYRQKIRDGVRDIVKRQVDLGIDVVAEGIETSEQLDWLLDVGCRYGQGFYFSKPLDVAAATDLLANEPTLWPDARLASASVRTSLH